MPGLPGVPAESCDCGDCPADERVVEDALRLTLPEGAVAGSWAAADSVSSGYWVLMDRPNLADVRPAAVNRPPGEKLRSLRAQHVLLLV